MNVTSPVLPHAASGAETGSSSGLPTSQGLNNMFLQLLVAQLQNQNPLDPMDPTQFVGQLAQFSELSEVTQIEQILEQAISSKSPTGTPSPSPDAANRPAPAVPAGPKTTASPAREGTFSGITPEASSLATSIFSRQIQGAF